MAFGTVKIDEKEFNFRSSAATELFYKQVFGDKEMPYEKFAAILRKRVTQLTQIPEMLDFFAQLPEYEKELFVNKKSKTNLENAPVVLKEATDRLRALPEWTALAHTGGMPGKARRWGHAGEWITGTAPAGEVPPLPFPG